MPINTATIDLTRLSQLAAEAQSVENNEGEFWLRFGAWGSELQLIIKLIAESHGHTFIRCDRTGSMYPRIEDADGCEICEVRISQHDQRYAGACWSFELSDSEASIRRGLATIDGLCE